jgi:hypothetical protein
MSGDATEPEPAGTAPERVVKVMQVIFAAQLLAMLLVLAGGALLILTLLRNNSLDCSGYGFPGTGTVSCSKHSYAWPVGLLIGGFGLFVVGIFVSAQYALKHVGAPLLGALRAKRRLLEQQSARPAGRSTGDAD